MTHHVVNFGCRLNSYEGEAIREALSKAKAGDTVVINSCAVTKEAERQARQAIRRAKREFPQAKIVVTGCAAQVNPQQFAQMVEVDQVLGNQEKFEVSSYEFSENSAEERVSVNDIMEVKTVASHMVSAFEGRVRAFLQVQNGCNHRCTFCIIPYGRGNSRSVAPGEIVAQARQLVVQGCEEIVLTGVDITDYGKDLPGAPSLGEMSERLLRLVPELKRLRFSSLDVAEIDETLLRLLAEEERVMPHVHLSLQAGDDLILKRMKRRHLSADIRKFCNDLRAKRPEIVFGADLIAGFPTETEEQFANSLALVEELEIALLHVFPFSARENTPAAKMPQLPMAIRKERAAKLRAKGDEILQKIQARYVGKRFKVVMESPQIARADDFTVWRVEENLVAGESYYVRALSPGYVVIEEEKNALVVS